MFSVTPNAAAELLAAAARSDASGMALRVAARQTADGSLEYGMGFDEEREDDLVVEVGGLTVLVGSPSKPLLDDTVLDYVEVAPSRFDFLFAPADTPADAGSAGPAAPEAGGCGSGGCSNCR